MDLARSTSTTTNESAKPFRGRRMNWEEFYQLRPDLRPTAVATTLHLGKAVATAPPHSLSV